MAQSDNVFARLAVKKVENSRKFSRIFRFLIVRKFFAALNLELFREICYTFDVNLSKLFDGEKIREKKVK